MPEKKTYLKAIVNVYLLHLALPDESKGCRVVRLETENPRPLILLKLDDFTCPVARDCTLTCALNSKTSVLTLPPASA